MEVRRDCYLSMAEFAEAVSLSQRCMTDDVGGLCDEWYGWYRGDRVEYLYDACDDDERESILSYERKKMIQYAIGL